MKKLLKSLVLALLLNQMFTSVIFAEESSITTPIVQTVRLERLETYGDKAPRTVLFDYIECRYTTECVEFEIPEFVESLCVIISANGIVVWEGELTQVENNVISLRLPNSCVVTCVTESEQVYQGILTF